MRYLVILLLTGTAALAHQGATGIVKERMDGMKAIASAMKELTAISKSGQGDPARISALAATIQSHAGQQMIDRFPEGSVDHPSEASEKIWSEPDGFATEADALATAAKAIIANPGALEAGLKAAGQTCKSCHSAYRIKK